MAFMRKAMVFLGLDDEETEDYDSYDESAAAPAAAAPTPARRYQQEPADPSPSDRPLAGIRPMPREGVQDSGGSVRVTQRPAPVRPIISPVGVHAAVVVATRFADAKEVGERFKNGAPVVVNLKEADGPLSRRMIDFCSGVTYSLSGTMEKLAPSVFLLTPEHMEVPADERRSLHDKGFYDS